MKRLLISQIKAFSISLLLIVAAYLLFGCLLFSVLLGLLIFFVLARHELAFICNYLFRTQIFFLKSFDYLKFNNRIAQEMDIINLGSSSGKYAFNYQQIRGFRCMNMAIEPQTLYYDFCILKQYSSFLKANSTVILPLCPFSGCIRNFEDKYINGRYTTFLHPSLIHNVEGLPSNTSFIFNDNPIHHICTLVGIKRLFHILLKSRIRPFFSRCWHRHNFERNAMGRMNSWLRQFDISDLTEKVSKDIEENISYNSSIIKCMEEFCMKRSINFVVVIPPAMPALKTKFPDEFWGLYIKPLLDKLSNGTPVLNYWNNKKYENKKMFKDSYLLNHLGSKFFTEDIISVINELYYDKD